MKIWKKMLCAASLVLGGTVAFAAPAAAQASRTWVSGVGDDANPCSRTAPCKTFGGAISKTAAGGEINCLDPGGWGAVTITKAITIDCSQFPGGVANNGTPGIIVNAGATDDVVIRGLEIAGGTGGSSGTSGVRFLAGGSLTLESVIIRNQQLGDGAGIAFLPSTTAKFALKNVTIVASGSGSGAGILIQPTGGSGSAQGFIDRVTVSGGSASGIKVDGSSSGAAGVVLQMTNSVVAGNNVGVFLYSTSGTAPVRAMLVGDTIANNTNTGLLVNGSTIAALASDITINNNGQGVVNVGGLALSYQDNRVFGNGSNNSFPATIGKQ